MLKICPICGKEFNGKPKQLCCSRECSTKNRYKAIYVKCDICGKEIKRTQSEIKRSKHHYCSNRCRAKGVGKYQSGKNNPNYKNANTIVNCSYCGKEIKILNCDLKNSDGKLKKDFYCNSNCKAKHQHEKLKGSNNPNFKDRTVLVNCDCCGKSFYTKQYKIKNNKNVYCSQECKKEHQKITMLKENNPNYKSDLSEEYRLEHRIIEGYNTWRREVLERDGYTCQKCGNKDHLATHHIKNYMTYKEGRTDINNGITLCVDCHKKFHEKYGNKNNDLNQIKEFLNKQINPVTN